MRRTILDGLRVELLGRCPLSSLPSDVVRAMGVLDTWGSNAIEGNSLSLAEVGTVLLEARTPGGRPVRDVLETVQHMAAFEGLWERTEDPVGTKTAIGIHHQVFRGVLPEAGRLRRDRVRITGAARRTPEPEWLMPMLTDWEQDLEEREMVGEDILATAAWMHHRFEAIHPFSEGNGRVGRLLWNLHLLRHNWPPVHVLPVDRDRYLDALEVANAGVAGPLEDLLAELAGRTFLDLLDRLGTDDDALAPVSRLGAEGPHSAKYLALRASQGQLPAVKRKGRWLTSRRAISLYRAAVGNDR